MANFAGLKVIASDGERYLLAPSDWEPEDSAFGYVVDGATAYGASVMPTLARGDWNEVSDVDTALLEAQVAEVVPLTGRF